MEVSIGLWRANIGGFHASSKSYYQGKKKRSPKFFSFYASLTAYLVNITNQYLSLKYSFFGFYILLFINLILLCGDIEVKNFSLYRIFVIQKRFKTFIDKALKITIALENIH